MRAAQKRQRIERYWRSNELPPLQVGNSVMVNRNRRSNIYLVVVQEFNLRCRKYTIRLPSGLIVSRNRSDLRLRYPPDTVLTAGISEWSTYEEQFARNHSPLDLNTDEEDVQEIGH